MSAETLAGMEKKFKEAQENPVQLRETIEVALKDMLKKESQEDQNIQDYMSDKDTEELIEFILQSLKNHSIKKAGKGHYQFSPYLMGLAMNQYLQGPTAYERFREVAMLNLGGMTLVSKAFSNGEEH